MQHISLLTLVSYHLNLTSYISDLELSATYIFIYWMLLILYSILVLLWSLHMVMCCITSRYTPANIDLRGISQARQERSIFKTGGDKSGNQINFSPLAAEVSCPVCPNSWGCCLGEVNRKNSGEKRQRRVASSEVWPSF